MGDTDCSVKSKLVQQLQSLQPSMMSELGTMRVSLNEEDLEALRLLAEGTGTCRFKSFGWSDPVSLAGSDRKSVILRALLALLWQTGELQHKTHDPFDLRLRRPNRKVEQQKNEDKEEALKEMLPNETNYTLDQLSESDGCTDPVSNEANQAGGEAELPPKLFAETTEDTANDSDDEVALDEDGTNYLIGPLEVDLKRIDSHHPLFATHRKSTHIRVDNFLKSSHIKHVRKLSGIDRSRFGWEFNRKVLELTASSVEDLELDVIPDLGALELLRNLSWPRLRRLNVWVFSVVDYGEGWSHDHDQSEDPKTAFVFPPATEEHVGLRWLRMRLPLPAARSLLQSNNKTLMELEVCVGTAGTAAGDAESGGWPMRCADLAAVLVDCGLRGTLKRLVLLRKDLSGGALVRKDLLEALVVEHTRASCREQVDAVRSSMPGLAVVCNVCSADRECWWEPKKLWHRAEWGWDTPYFS